MAKLLRALLLGVAVFSSTTAFPQQNRTSLLTVDESKISFHLLPNTGLDIPIFNNSDHPLKGTILLELLDSTLLGKVEAKQVRTLEVTPGAHTSSAEWNPKPPSPSPTYLNDYRLRYTVTPQQEGDFEPVEGIVQLGLHIADGFEIHGYPGGQFQCTPDCRFWVRVAEPITGHPWPNTEVEASVHVAHKAGVIKQKAITDQDGYADFHFDLPVSRTDSYGQLEIDAYRGPFKVGVGGSIGWAQPTRLTLSTDKPLYQPGQTVHLRALVFGFDGRAWENATVILKITGQDGQEQFRAPVATSKFGVASADWVVPEKVRLGNYSVAAAVEERNLNPRYYKEAHCDIRVSRYDLAAFKIHVAADRPYYLPGQEATLEISGQYLFGRGVRRGKVRVSEGWGGAAAPAEGELDASGKFVAHLDLKRQFTYLEGAQQSGILPETRFLDSSLSIFLTDASTGRTEQRRFTLRVSLQPIHLYVARPVFPSGSEKIVYITSSYADGSPASVDGTVEAVTPDEAGKFERSPDAAHRIPLAAFHTNRYGVARVILPKGWMEYTYPRTNDGYYSWYLHPRRLDAPSGQLTKRACILLHASDQHGQEGTDREQVPVLPISPFAVQIRTDRSLYHAGDPIHVGLQTDSGLSEALVEVETENSRVAAVRVVHLENGEGKLTFPYNPEFRGLVKIWSYAIKADDEPNPTDVRCSEVIYPAGESLKVGVHLPHTTFRPGKTAMADIQVKNVAGASVESDVGVAVIDRSVEERVRTEKEFGGEIGFSHRRYSVLGSLEQNPGIAGVTKLDLLNLDPAKPFTDGLDLVAEALLFSNQGYSDWPRGVRFPRPESLDKQYLLPVVTALDRLFQTSGRYPTTGEELRAELKKSGIDLNSVRDAWGDPYRPLFTTQDENAVLFLVSNGPDKIPDTNDDYVAHEFRWPYFRRTGEALDKVAAEYHDETGKCFQDYNTLRTEMRKKKDIDLDALLDPWGTPYRFTFALSGNQCTISVKSAGLNKKFLPQDTYCSDCIKEWTTSVPYFVQETIDLERALDERYAQTGEFPQNDEGLKPVLEAAKLTGDRLLDPWGKPYHFSFFSDKRYSDRVETQTYTEYLGGSGRRPKLLP